jgi:hypothetical protein
MNTPASNPTPVQRPASNNPAAHGAFVPLLLLGLTLLIWLGFQCVQLLNERAALQAAHASQQQTVDSAAKLRGSLDALAADTQRLAEAGNANAAALVAELSKRGITINPNAPKAEAAGNAASAPR